MPWGTLTAQPGGSETGNDHVQHGHYGRLCLKTAKVNKARHLNEFSNRRLTTLPTGATVTFLLQTRVENFL